MKRTKDSARLVAEAYLACAGNATQAYLRLHPEASYATANANGGKLMKEPAVQAELARLAEKSGRTAEQFLRETTAVWDKLKDALAKGETPPRHVVEAGLASQRILAKALLNDSGDKDKQPAPSVSFGNIGADEIASMTETATGAATGANGVKRVQ